ncbi:DUF5134 domain-containing protein [Streptomyces sp. NBC_01725]|uniref:DUF5134 domain-containing protein n=1 Tax=Streptomyces sp. NBC_01725 TaxID=2975923 RepID=UPI002E27D9E6|nr:DUF5134 domain-containing protein [Streptomyces sp. NBC_01725]
MHGPATAGWLVVVLCAAAGTHCLLRLRRARATGRGSAGGRTEGTAGGEALMGFGMAAMAVPAAVVTPPRWVWLAYVAVFGVAALRALGPARRTSHHLHHLLGMLATVYMSVAMALLPGGTHGAHSAGGTPLATGVLLIYYAGYVLWTGARLLPLQTVTVAEGGGPVGPGAADHAAGGVVGGALGDVRPTGAPTGVVTDTAPEMARDAPTGLCEDGPELALACRLSMGIAMLAMLLTL